MIERKIPVTFDLADAEDCQRVLVALLGTTTPTAEPTSAPEPAAPPAPEPAVPKPRRGRPKGSPNKPKAKATKTDGPSFTDVRAALAAVITAQGTVKGTELLHTFQVQEGSPAFTDAERGSGVQQGDTVRFVTWLTEDQWPLLITQSKEMLAEPAKADG